MAGLWNALVMYRVAREARLRLFGHRLAYYLIDEMLTEEFVANLSERAKEGAIRAISTMMVLTQNYHPKLLMLLVKFSETLAIEDRGDNDNWSVFVRLLNQVTAAERYFLLDLLCVAATFDVHLSRPERQRLPQVFGEFTDPYMERIRKIKALMLTGQIHTAKDLCRLDFQPG